MRGRDGGEVRPQAEPGRGKVCGVGGMVGVKSFSPMLIHTMNSNFVLVIVYTSEIDFPLLLFWYVLCYIIVQYVISIDSEARVQNMITVCVNELQFVNEMRCLISST